MATDPITAPTIATAVALENDDDAVAAVVLSSVTLMVDAGDGVVDVGVRDVSAIHSDVVDDVDGDDDIVDDVSVNATAVATVVVTGSHASDDTRWWPDRHARQVPLPPHVAQPDMLHAHPPADVSRNPGRQSVHAAFWSHCAQFSVSHRTQRSPCAVCTG
jgi:hypothetical protein